MESHDCNNGRGIVRRAGDGVESTSDDVGVVSLGVVGCGPSLPAIRTTSRWV
jgi:hypothetical protein